MTIASIVAAVMFAGLAIVHSASGDSGFIRPLINAEWQIAEVPRWAANRLLRTAWHLTSIAWLAMAAVAVGAAPVPAISLAAVASGLMMLVGVAAHPAWPAFLLAGTAGLYSDGQLGDGLLATAGGVTAAVAIVAGAVHVYWAFGGTAGLHAAVPPGPDGQPPTIPGPMLTLAVAAALAGFAALVTLSALTDAPAPIRWLTLAGAAVLAARAVGDGRIAGFSKKDRSTLFSRMDDQFYTPLCVFLAFGAVAAALT